jgi:dihydromethanopterin reductase (acceptor)
MSGHPQQPRLAWVLTGSGHFFTECLDLMHEIGELDVFVSKAAAEVVRMYKQDLSFLPDATRVFRDTTASAAPVGGFYLGAYHTLVVAPATSNSVAKFVWGISDNLATNIFAHAGKCRVPVIVFACDSAPELDSEAPGGMVKVYPRKVDLENVERLKTFEGTTVVGTVEALRTALAERIACLSASSS